jgi:glycosyltransferase involved in cell wall biosynthesis
VGKKKTKVAYVISNIDRWIPFEWIEEHFRDSEIQIEFFLLSENKGYFFNYLKQNGQCVHWLKFKGKLSYPKVITWLLFNFWVLKKFDAVHCHFLDATICGLTVAKIAGIRKRIFTRHHSTSHHEFAPKGVLYDKYCNHISTQIIAISDVVKKTLIEKEGVNANKIVTVHHGFKLEEIREVDDERIQNISAKYQLQGKFVIGVVSRFIELKGLQYIIPAFKEFLKENNSAVLILANARGNYSEKVNFFLKDIPSDNYRLIPFEKDIYALFHNFNIFIHVPINPDIEAFGQIYIEALAAGVPSIFTLSGIAHDFIINETNALIVPYCDSNGIYNAINRLLKDENKSEDLRQNGRKDISQLFGLKTMVDQLTNLYSN